MKSFTAVIALLSCTLVAANPIEIIARQTEPAYITTIIEVPQPDCTFRPTATSTATTGCPTTCTPSGLCFADAAVTLGCGCTSMAVQPTTVTVCPTATVCSQCKTGWGIVTVTPTTCPAETPAPLPTLPA